MQIEHKTGETTVKDKDGNETKQTYELDMHLPESVSEYEDAVLAGEEPFANLLKEDEDADAQTLRAVRDYEQRRQRANARPSQTRGTGAQKFQRAIGAALKNNEVSEEDLAKALAALKVKVKV